MGGSNLCGFIEATLGDGLTNPTIVNHRLHRCGMNRQDQQCLSLTRGGALVAVQKIDRLQSTDSVNNMRLRYRGRRAKWKGFCSVWLIANLAVGSFLYRCDTHTGLGFM